MGKLEEAIQEYLNDPDVTVYYDYYDNNRPDYAVNNETGEITIFQYGYFGHTEGKTMNDIPEVDCSGNIIKEAIFNEIDDRLEKIICEYNAAKAHDYKGSNDSTAARYWKTVGQYEALMDLREELENEYYW